MNVNFRKMDGAGNDFVIFDIRGHHAWLKKIATHAPALADRGNPITKGCDQVITLEEGAGGADVRMRIFNPDGSQVGACGNATRCVGWLAMKAKNKKSAKIEAGDRVLVCEMQEPGVRVDMGKPGLSARQLHLSDTRVDTLQLPIRPRGFGYPTGVSMGNPHMVFFVADLSKVALAEIGPKLEKHPLYKQHANVSFAQVISPSEVKVAVWERGAGITQACGTAACAVGVSGVRRGLTGRDIKVHMPGGELRVEWLESNGHVYLSGPVRDHGEGTVEL